MKKLAMINGEILLDGEKIPCLKKFNIASSVDGTGIAELTICIDVSIGPEVQIESATK